MHYDPAVFIPLGTDRALRRPTLINNVLIAANVGVYCATTVLGRVADHQLMRLEELAVLDPRHLLAWTLVTYAFLHADLMHLLGNMLFLWVFGPNVEDRLGRIGYPVFYLFGAVGAGGLHALFETSPVVGASGAIAAVTGAYLVLFPHTAIKTLVVFFYIGVVGIPAWWFIGGQIVWNLWMQASAHGGNIAVLAHLGGYGYGIVVSMALLGLHILDREPYDLFTISRQAARRRQFREVGYQRERQARGGVRPDAVAPACARRGEAAPDPLPEAVQTARAEIVAMLDRSEPDAAAAAYRRLLEAHGAAPRFALLSRRAQYDIANALFSAGDVQTAATAYELFLEAYPTDPEAPVMRLMLGLINARYLNDPVRAKQEITKAMGGLPAGDQRELAGQLLAELG